MGAKSLVLSTAVTLLAPLGVAHAGPNLIVNGDFSNGSNGWTLGSDAAITTTEGNPAPSVALHADAGAVVSITSDCISQTAVPVTLHVDAKSATSGVNVAIMTMQYSDGACATYLSQGPSIGRNLTTGGWESLDYSNASMASDTHSVRIKLQVNRSGLSAATAFLDNVSFAPADATPVELQSFGVR